MDASIASIPARQSLFLRGLPILSSRCLSFPCLHFVLAYFCASKVIEQLAVQGATHRHGSSV
jgi:hypothetical protein